MVVAQDGCVPVFGGKIIHLEDNFMIELMGPVISGHPYNLTGTYISSQQGEAKKIALQVNDKGELFIQYFKSKKGMKPFSRTNYLQSEVPLRYQEIYRRLCEVHRTIFLV